MLLLHALKNASVPIVTVIGIGIGLFAILGYALLRALNPTFRLTTGVDWDGKLLTHTTILREVWGEAYADESHYLHVYVSQLRRKIEPDLARPRYLLTEPGAGYRLVDPES